MDEFTYKNAQHLDTIWELLFHYREAVIPEGYEKHDSLWNDVTYAMAKIHEALGVPHDVIN